MGPLIGPALERTSKGVDQNQGLENRHQRTSRQPPERCSIPRASTSTPGDPWGFSFGTVGKSDPAPIPRPRGLSGSNPSDAPTDPGIFRLAPWVPRDRTPSRSAALNRCAGSLERMVMGTGWEWKAVAVPHCEYVGASRPTASECSPSDRRRSWHRCSPPARQLGTVELNLPQQDVCPDRPQHEGNEEVVAPGPLRHQDRRPQRSA
jgi:hypothetical protein